MAGDIQMRVACENDSLHKCSQQSKCVTAHFHRAVLCAQRLCHRDNENETHKSEQDSKCDQ